MYRIKKESDCYLIYVPLSIADDLLSWFHKNLLHHGASRLAETVRQIFYVKNLDERAKELVRKCPKCQESKVTAVQPVGQVPMQMEQSTKPFEVVQIDCCGPWKIKAQCQKPKKTLTKEVHTVTITLVTKLAV